MSQLRTLCTKLASKVVTYTTEMGALAIVQCDDLGSRVVGSSQPDLPRRYLMLNSYVGGNGSNGVPLTLGVTNTGAEIDWTVIDICLLAEVGQGGGQPQVFDPDTARYCDAYTEMIFDDTSIGFTSNDTFTIKGLRFDIVSDFQSPNGTGNYFYAVIARLTVCEKVNWG